MRYTDFIESVGITNAEATKTLNEVFPGFTKIQAVYVKNPMRYGICLTKKAERVLIEKYGKPKPKPPRKPSVKLSAETADILKAKAEAANLSVDEYIKGLL